MYDIECWIFVDEEKSGGNRIAYLQKDIADSMVRSRRQRSRFRKMERKSTPILIIRKRWLGIIKRVMKRVGLENLKLT